VSTAPVPGAANAIPVAPAGDSSKTATPAASNDRNVVICKGMAPPTGTRLGERRICHTLAEWEEISRNDQKDLTDLTRQSGLTGVMKGGP